MLLAAFDNLDLGIRIPLPKMMLTDGRALINDRQVARVKDQIDDAVAKGATIALGGGVNGRFVEPTILLNVTRDMKVYKDETFGQLFNICRDELVAIFNHSLNLAAQLHINEELELLPVSSQKPWARNVR